MHRHAALLFCAIVVTLFLTVASSRAASFVQNPSFELNHNPVFPHYGTVDLWGGGSGVNESSGPFHNSATQIPDRARVAFLQGPATLSQGITGLIPGQSYWLQFFYDARNCCGGTVDAIVRVNGVQVDRINNIRPTPMVPNRTTYYFRNVLFTPETADGTLEFSSVTIGDATLVLDAVTIVPAEATDVVVINPSFEASGDLSDGPLFLPGQGPAGWTSGGQALVGLNTAAGPYQDTAVIPDQDHAVFLQEQSSISQLLDGLIPGTNYQVSFSYSARSFEAPHLRVTIGSEVLFDTTLGDFDPTAPFPTFTGTFTATDITALLTFEQTEPGQIVFLDRVRVSGATRPPLDCLGISPTAAELGPEQTLVVTVTVPVELTEDQPATVQFRSPNPAVAELVGAAEDGILSLFFDFAQTTNTFTIRAVGRGVTRMEIVDSAGLCTDNDVAVTVTTSFVRNPSFESSAVPPAPGYGSIVAWESTGQVGLNNVAGPIHDNGVVPDRRQVAFIQGPGTLAQEIVGLTPGRVHWLQFHYNARNCCAGGTVNLQVRFDGTELTTIPAIPPTGVGVPYHFRNLAFTPSRSSGRVEFVTTVAGDATLLLDAISIVQRDSGNVVVINPSFESTGVPTGVGYIGPDPFAGWTSAGGYGVNLNGVGPFTDNGVAPDQDVIALLQGAVFLSQNITGLTAGVQYTLLYAVNTRNCCNEPPITTQYSVSLAGQELLTEVIAPVGGANPYHDRAILFDAPASEGELRFVHTPIGPDRTLLLDNILLVEGDGRPRPRLRIAVDVQSEISRTVRLSWPLTYTGYILQCITDLESDLWADVPWPVQAATDEFFVIDDTSVETQKFYRLVLPDPLAAR